MVGTESWNRNVAQIGQRKTEKCIMFFPLGSFPQQKVATVGKKDVHLESLTSTNVDNDAQITIIKVPY